MSLEISERLENEQGISNFLMNIGMVMQFNGRVDEAEEIYHRCLELDKKHGALIGQALTIQNIATNYKERGDLDEAERLYRKSLAIKEKIGDQRDIGYSY